MVIVCAAVLLLTKWTVLSGPQEETELLERHDGARNERSTPRSFILPATPGISFEQERQVAEKAMLDQIAICVKKLAELGYDVGASSPVLDVPLVEAVYRFQIAQHLPPTGRMDSLTIKAMGCS